MRDRVGRFGPSLGCRDPSPSRFRVRWDCRAEEVPLRRARSRLPFLSLSSSLTSSPFLLPSLLFPLLSSCSPLLVLPPLSSPLTFDFRLFLLSSPFQAPLLYLAPETLPSSDWSAPHLPPVHPLYVGFFPVRLLFSFPFPTRLPVPSPEVGSPEGRGAKCLEGVPVTPA